MSVAEKKNERIPVKAWGTPALSPSVRNAPGYVSVILIEIVSLLGVSNVSYAADGFASYYTTASCQREGTSGVYTASREPFIETALTCALRRRDFGKSYMVYGHNTGKSVVVRHNDFGPGKGPTAKGVIVDLTPRAFREVCGDLKLGKCEVSMQEVK